MANTQQTLTIETPEKILFNYKIGNLGLRIAAYAIDILIQDIVFAIIVTILFLTTMNGNLWEGLKAFNDFDDTVIIIAVAVGFLVYFLLKWGYFLFWETLLNGQTLGKKICRIRVIRADGSRLDFSSLFLRNFLRCADALPMSDLLGGLMMLVSKQNKRLGDLAAGTVVVVDKRTNLAEPSFETNLTETNRPVSQHLLFIPVSKRLDEKNLYILRDILNNRGNLPTQAAIEVGSSIVKKLEQRIDISSIANLSNFEIIEEVYKAHHFKDQINTPEEESLNKTKNYTEDKNTQHTILATKSESFANRRKERWRQTVDMMKKIDKNRGIQGLSADDAQLFPLLYRQLTHDLAEARTLKLSPDILSYLNSLTGEAHHLLYFYQPLNGPTIQKFFKRTFPRGVIANYRYILAAMILFWGTGIALFFYIKHDPANAKKVVPSFFLDQMDSMYQESPISHRPWSERIFMAVYYINNNISIGFFSFATGVLLGIGSISLLLYNGVFLGAIFGYLAKDQNSFSHLVLFVTAHSFLELTGIVLCGAAGIRLGVALIQSWHNHSNLGIEKHKEDILTLLAIGTLMIFLAAFIESGISPMPIPYPVKVAIAGCSFLAFIGYFIAYPLISDYMKEQKRKRWEDDL